jgi:hypothetical protein
MMGKIKGMHKSGKKKTRKKVEDEKRMEGFIRRGCWPFKADKGQVCTLYSSFRRSRQVKTACAVDICGHRKEQKAANCQSLEGGRCSGQYAYCTIPSKLLISSYFWAKTFFFSEFS